MYVFICEVMETRVIFVSEELNQVLLVCCEPKRHSIIFGCGECYHYLNNT